MKFIIRKKYEEIWEWYKTDNITGEKVKDYDTEIFEDKIFLKTYNTLSDVYKKINAIFKEYNNDIKSCSRIIEQEYGKLIKWGFELTVIPVSDDFKSKSVWINPKNISKYMGE